jgi:TRAP transporter 4TM/12TM fusion protein
MAELTNIPYPVIAVSAILPAILYFTGIFLMIHFEAKKLGLKGLPRESIPKFRTLVVKGYLFLPVITLVGLMSIGFTPAYAACFAILAAILVSMIHKETRFTPTTFVSALTGGARNTIGVALACALAGVVIGIVSLTGLGQVLISLLLSVANNSLFLALFLTMIACLILGMGIPTTANYVIMATITAPIVVRMGVPVMAAHMFVFYFGIVADITPPVALAAYAGAAIAHSNPIKTGVTATRLAITAFIIPYIFVFSPSMLFIDTTPIQVIQIVISSCLGMLGLASGIEGYMFRRMPVFERLMAIGGGLCLIDPGLITDIVGFSLIASVIVLQLITRNRDVVASIMEEDSKPIGGEIP